jgi:hypothetical protein
MVRRARLQNVPAEESADKGPGKLTCNEGVSQREPLLVTDSETIYALVCTVHPCGTRAAPRIAGKLSAKFGQQVRLHTLRGGRFSLCVCFIRRV